ncbi:hypothetical protein K5D38_12310 [Pseudomonas cichorii]|nr:hypothetical protein [Pseudomonas cichorii]MBX8475564.1 hypothetical protein [Pseudomonas cichorii]GFM50315.1 hypothetical protein PSCICE_15820 [Pseudomonas cichorii]GFM55775.1 hypothetical protein PSCICF_19530 [Pseudomonas cichorii]
MSALLSIAVSAISLALASRLMNVALGIVPAVLVAAFSYGMSLMLEDSTQVVRIAVVMAGLLIYVAGLKRFTGESTWTVIKLMMVWIIVSVLVVQAAIQVL